MMRTDSGRNDAQVTFTNRARPASINYLPPKSDSQIEAEEAQRAEHLRLAAQAVHTVDAPPDPRMMNRRYLTPLIEESEDEQDGRGHNDELNTARRLPKPSPAQPRLTSSNLPKFEVKTIKRMNAPPHAPQQLTGPSFDQERPPTRNDNFHRAVYGKEHAGAPDDKKPQCPAMKCPKLPQYLNDVARPCGEQSLQAFRKQEYVAASMENAKLRADQAKLRSIILQSLSVNKKEVGAGDDDDGAIGEENGVNAYLLRDAEFNKLLMKAFALDGSFPALRPPVLPAEPPAPSFRAPGFPFPTPTHNSGHQRGFEGFETVIPPTKRRQ
jgi:hypothetical protein